MSATISLKFKFRDDIRRTIVPFDIPFRLVVETINRMFDIQSPSLMYVDDEDDFVTLIDDDDWNVARALAQNMRLVHVLVSTDGTPATYTKCDASLDRAIESEWRVIHSDWDFVRVKTVNVRDLYASLHAAYQWLSCSADKSTTTVTTTTTITTATSTTSIDTNTPRTSRIVSGRIIRGGRLDALTERELQHLPARTVINLRIEPDPPQLSTAIDGSKRRVLHFPLPNDHSCYDLSQHEVRVWLREVLSFMASLTPDDAPVYIHCRSGRDRSGLLAAMLALIVGESLDAIELDYMQSSGSHIYVERFRSAMQRFDTTTPCVPDATRTRNVVDPLQFILKSVDLEAVRRFLTEGVSAPFSWSSTSTSTSSIQPALFTAPIYAEDATPSKRKSDRRGEHQQTDRHRSKHHQSEPRSHHHRQSSDRDRSNDRHDRRR